MHILKIISMVLVLLCLSIGCYPAPNPFEPANTAGPDIDVKKAGGLTSYQAYHIPPIDVYSIEGDYLRRAGDKEVETLAETFRSKLIRELGDRYTSFPHPAANVAVLHIAITDVSSTYTAFQLVPGYVVPNALRGGATIEAKFIDSVTNEPIVLVRDSRSGDRQGFFSGIRKWDGVEKAFDEWADLLGDTARAAPRAGGKSFQGASGRSSSHASNNL